MKIEISEQVTENKKKCNENLDVISETLIKVKGLRDNLQSDNWSGDAKDRFMTFIDVLIDFHEDLKLATEKQNEAYKFLDEESENFVENNCELNELRKIKC